MNTFSFEQNNRLNQNYRQNKQTKSFLFLEISYSCPFSLLIVPFKFLYTARFHFLGLFFSSISFHFLSIYTFLTCLSDVTFTDEQQADKDKSDKPCYFGDFDSCFFFFCRCLSKFFSIIFNTPFLPYSILIPVTDTCFIIFYTSMEVNF